MKLRIATLITHAETKETEEREKARKEAEAEQVAKDLHAAEETNRAGRARLREIEAKVMEQERQSQEFSRLQALERLLEKGKVEERAKVDRESAEETLRQQRVGNLKAAQDEREAQEETSREKEFLEKIKAANEAMLRAEGEMYQSRGTRASNEGAMR